MAEEEDSSSGGGDGGVFLTEYIMISILLRLPIASCIARFRCVCRSWRILLSDPQFIRRILIFNSDHQNKSSSFSLQILITGGGDFFTPPHLRPRHYSLLSYHTLRPISSGDLPSNGQSSFHSLVVAGSCDGIFCLVNLNSNPSGGAPDVIMWNPATSETQFLPASTGSPRRPVLFPHRLITCFGFDPQANDYKVARIMCFDDEEQDDDDGPLYYMTENLEFITYAEVYSLRNKSWKRLTINDDVHIPPSEDGAGYLEVQQQHGNYHRSKRCWFYAKWEVCFTLSFDMTEEVFKSTSNIALPHPIRQDSYFLWGCFMLKNSLHAIFDDFGGYDEEFSVWCLLKHGVADSWTKLYTFVAPPDWIVEFLHVWKEDTYICSREHREYLEGGAKNKDDGVFIYSPAMGNIGDRIETLGTTHPFQAHIFTPTQVSLSDFWEEQ